MRVLQPPTNQTIPMQRGTVVTNQSENAKKTDEEKKVFEKLLRSEEAALSENLSKSNELEVTYKKPNDKNVKIEGFKENPELSEMVSFVPENQVTLRKDSIEGKDEDAPEIKGDEQASVSQAGSVKAPEKAPEKEDLAEIAGLRKKDEKAIDLPFEATALKADSSFNGLEPWKNFVFDENEKAQFFEEISEKTIPTVSLQKNANEAIQNPEELISKILVHPKDLDQEAVKISEQIIRVEPKNVKEKQVEKSEDLAVSQKSTEATPVVPQVLQNHVAAQPTTEIEKKFQKVINRGPEIAQIKDDFKKADQILTQFNELSEKGLPKTKQHVEMEKGFVSKNNGSASPVNVQSEEQKVFTNPQIAEMRYRPLQASPQVNRKVKANHLEKSALLAKREGAAKKEMNHFSAQDFIHAKKFDGKEALAEKRAQNSEAPLKDVNAQKHLGNHDRMGNVHTAVANPNVEMTKGTDHGKRPRTMVEEQQSESPAKEFKIENGSKQFVSQQANDSKAETVKEITMPVTMGAGAKERLSTNSLENVASEINRFKSSGSGEMKIRLKPDHLGELLVKVKTQGGSVGLEIVASNAQAKKILEISMSDLKGKLFEHQLKLDKFELSVGNPIQASSHSSQEQNSNLHQQNTPQWNAQMDMNQGRSGNAQDFRDRAEQAEQRRLTAAGRAPKIRSITGISRMSQVPARQGGINIIA